MKEPGLYVKDTRKIQIKAVFLISPLFSAHDLLNERHRRPQVHSRTRPRRKRRSSPCAPSQSRFTYSHVTRVRMTRPLSYMIQQILVKETSNYSAKCASKKFLNLLNRGMKTSSKRVDVKIWIIFRHRSQNQASALNPARLGETILDVKKDGCLGCSSDVPLDDDLNNSDL